jgi:hypothetical protein
MMNLKHEHVPNARNYQSIIQGTFVPNEQYLTSLYVYDPL